MLGQAVDEALDELPQLGLNRNRLIAHMIRALESDSNWVELYGITGELKVPTSDDDAMPKEVLIRIREVGCSSTAGVIARICGRLSFRRSWKWVGLALRRAVPGERSVFKLRYHLWMQVFIVTLESYYS